MNNNSVSKNNSAKELLDIIFLSIAVIAREPDLEKQLLLLADLGRDVTVSDRCSIWVWDKELGEFWTKVAHGISRVRISDEFGIVSAAARSGENTIINDPYADSRFDKNVDIKTGYKTKSILALPLRNSQREVIGVFQAINKKTESQSYTSEDIDHCCLVATYIEKQLENTILFQQVKDSKEALRLSEERLQLILESTNDGFWEWFPQERRLFVNDFWAQKVCFYMPPQSFEELARDQVHPEDRPTVESLYKHHLEGKSFAYDAEYRILNKYKKWIWVEELGRVVSRDDEGNPIRIVGTFKDVTQRKLALEEKDKLEAQMKHVQRLESLGVMAGGVAHDFNNFLATIMGNAELVLLDLPENSPLRTFVDHIRQASIRSTDLVRQLLNYSGKGQISVESCNLNNIIGDISDLVKASLSKKASIRYELYDKLPEIDADLAQIRQIIMNLIINASDSLGHLSGSIYVQTGKKPYDPAYFKIVPVQSEEAEKKSYVYINVTDTGIGMDSDTLNRIFEPFFSTKEAGRGLGLAAVVGIVKSHGGGIQIDSKPGRGTTFSIVFPVSEETDKALLIKEGEQFAPCPNDRSGIILIADDEPSLRELMEATLTRAGYTVIVAIDGEEAISKFSEHGPEIDLVIMDMSMPKMDGVDAMERLGEIDSTVPVILISGYSEIPKKWNGRPPAAFLNKPFPRALLLRKIWNLLGH